MAVFTAAVAAVAAAVATTTVVTVAAAVVAVSMAVGVVGLAVTAVGMVTGNKDLLKAGKIMGYVGLAGGLAGGIAGGFAGAAGSFALADPSSSFLTQIQDAAGSFGEGFTQTFADAANTAGNWDKYDAWMAKGDVVPLPTDSSAATAVNAAVPGGTTTGATSTGGTVPNQNVALTNMEDQVTQAQAFGTPAASANITPDINTVNTGTAIPVNASTGVNNPAAPGQNFFSNSTPAISGQYGATPSNADVFNANANRLMGAGNLTGTQAAAPGMFDFMKNVPDYIKYGGVTAVGQAGAGLLQGVMASSNLDDQNRLKAQEIAVAQQAQNRQDAQLANNMAPIAWSPFANNQYRGPAGILNS